MNKYLNKLNSNRSIASLLTFSPVEKHYFLPGGSPRLGGGSQGSRHPDLRGTPPVHCPSVRHYQGPYKKGGRRHVSHQGGGQQLLC